MRTTALVLSAFILATPALADGHGGPGDVAAGEKAFNQCQTCHIVADAEGKVLAGRNAKTGPNLYGVIGRQAGSRDDFKYGNDIVAAGEAGLVWNAELLAEYMQDPPKFLRATLNNNRARSLMSHKVRKADDAANIAAFLASLAPAPEEAATTN